MMDIVGESIKVYIVVLNYKNLADTLECLESLFRLSYKNFTVVFVDNNSMDGSVEGVILWAQGRKKANIPDNCPIDDLKNLVVEKPIQYCVVDEGKINEVCLFAEVRLVIISSADNRGYAAGNNKGIKYALAQEDCDYLWILNNDIVVEREVLNHLVEAMIESSRKEKVGLMAHKLNFYNNPQVIQAVGGVYNRFMASSRHLGEGESDLGQYDCSLKAKSIDYPVGASILVKKIFIDDVGLMSEDYFLYFEEIDWTIRGQRRGWALGYCWEGKIFHKEGSSAGSSMLANQVGLLADFYSVRNKVTATRNLYPIFLPLAIFSFSLSVLNRIRRGHFLKAKNLVFGRNLPK